MTQSSDSAAPQHHSSTESETPRNNGAAAGAAESHVQDNNVQNGNVRDGNVQDNAAADADVVNVVDDGASLMVPAGGEMLPVVALGGSAGGVQALNEFFDHMPAESGVAFVVILHLSPDRESNLSRVLQNHTSMPVTPVTERIKVEPNHVYVIAPNRQLVMSDGHLDVSELEAPRGKRVAIDLFFRTLAEAHRSHAACIVLSGANSDGSIGLKRIKEWSGLTIAQDPNEAEYEEMPRAAIATGLVDWVLPVAQMPQRLIGYLNLEKTLQLPPIDPPPVSLDAPNAAPPVVAHDEAALQEVLAFLRMRTGHDFSSYKCGTVLRRLARRLQVNGLSDLPFYLDFLRTHAGEAQSLLQDLLISVTNFFRDSDAFLALEAALPQVFRGKNSGEPVRVWVCACATGEEAYSVAMLLIEYSMSLPSPPVVQVFATDLDGEAIAVARDGLYSPAIATDVSEERLRRFFTKEHAGYRVRREVREAVLFAEHNVLRDSPFSRLDLVTCRNMLIYFNREAQNRVFDIFHFALRHEGLMFLGVSDSADEASALFATTDRKNRLYVRRTTARLTLPRLDPRITPIESDVLASDIPDHVPSMHEAAATRSFAPPASFLSSARLDGDALRELHFELIEQYARPSLVVNENLDIVHLSRRAGRFLQIAGGPPTLNLLDVVAPALRAPLRAALFRAGQSQIAVDVPRVAVEIEGARRLVDVAVRPIQNPAAVRGYSLVIFDEKEATPAVEPLALNALKPDAQPPDAQSPVVQSSDAQQLVAQSLDVLEPVALETVAQQLEAEVAQLKSDLSATVEQFEASTEELKASNEELQAMNEELRAAGEELETGKEELQSINEELTTLNQEAKKRVEDLSRANSDLQNLMAATGIATLFLDRELRIMRYTPPAVELFNLIPTDAGRPLSDLAQRVEYESLQEDADRVLDSLIPTERELRTANGRCFLARLRPYRTMEDRISGVVLTFVDITERKQKEDETHQLVQRLDRQRRLFDTTLTAISDFAYIFDRQGRFRYANQPLLDLLGLTLEEIVGKNFFDLNYPPELAERLQRQIEEVFENGTTIRDETLFRSASNTDGFYEYIFTPVFGEDGQTVEVVAGSTRDVSERRHIEDALRESRERLQMAMEVGQVFTWEMDPANRVLEWSSNMESVVGFPLQHDVNANFLMIHPEDFGRASQEIEAAMEGGEELKSEFRLVNPANGEATWFHAQGALRKQADGSSRFVGITQNIAERKRAEVAQMNFRQLFESAPGLYLVIEPQTFRIVAASDAYLQGAMLTTREAIMGKNIFELFPADVRNEENETLRNTLRDIRQSFERVQSEGRSDVMAVQYFPIVNREGDFEDRWWSPVNSPICGESGEVAYIIHRVEDVTPFVLKRRAQGREDEAFVELESRMQQVELDIVLRGQELQKANEQLRYSEQRLQKALQIETVGVIFFNAQGDFTGVNAAFSQMSSWSREEVEARHLNWRDVTPPQWKELTAQIFAELNQTGRTAPYEKELLRADGSSFWGLFAASKIGDNEIVEYVIDITERKLAEQRVLEGEERMRRVMHAAQLGTWDWDVARDEIAWNNEHFLLLGLQPDGELKTYADFEQAVHPDDRAMVKEKLRAATEGQGQFAAEFRVLFPASSTRSEVRWLWTEGTALMRDENGTTRMSGVLLDVSSRRNAEDALQRTHDELEARVAERTLELTRINEELRGSEARFSQAFMASPLPILVTTLQEGRVLDLNPSALRSLGRQRSDIIGQLATEASDWQFSDGNLEQIASRLQQEGILNNAEATYRTAAGELRDILTFMNLIELNGEKCILTMVQDVTERKRAEQERQQLLDRILLAQEEERRRISRELHDQMGQQLTVLMMGIKALPEHPDAGWSKPSYETQVEDLQRLTVELMQQMHRLAWDLRPASLDNLGLEAALRQYVAQWSEQSGVQADLVSTGLTSGARPSPEVETALYRVVQEALANVQRHAGARHVSVLVEHRKDNVIAVIEDDGCGYQTEEKKEGLDGRQRSARLGLLGMGERMELVGGTLTIESSLDQGTTVFARAPMQRRETP